MHPETPTAQPEPTATKRPWYRRAAPLTCAAAVVVAATLGVAVPLSASAASVASGSSTTVAAPAFSGDGGRSGAGSSGGGGAGSGSGGQGTGTGTGTTQAAATTADAGESTGVVLVETVLGYDDGAAAGTGMVLTSDGLVLTNNHVIADSTEITVTIASTGETYTATVVGVDVDDDVALLQLQGASGLATVTVDQDDDAAVGDAITAVGNAEGGGVLLAADGTITGLDTSVTTSSDGASASETLDGMIQISADVVSGDSGGALLDDEGEVIGMNTAASSGRADVTAYAIPIDDALTIVQEILDGDESNGVTLGYPAFLGVELGQSNLSSSDGPRGQRGSTGATTSGATIAGVVSGTPAAAAGLTAGDTITAVDGTAIADASGLSAALSGHAPGDSVTITWTDAAGAEHSATVTLIAGPAA
ncbi:S1C family serine protease [Microbacterium sp.]|uniref:S1C family serine protease n=1 Tax=Microbacterium sp. TaxID=51671 RepID=UPI0039E635C7